MRPSESQKTCKSATSNPQVAGSNPAGGANRSTTGDLGVLIVEPGRGPTFRTVNPEALSDRSAEGPDDKPLRLLIRRTPSPIHGAARGAPSSGRTSAGHTRAATHRTADR